VSLFYCDSPYYRNPSAPPIGRVANTIRAAESFHGAAWYDWLEYRGPDGTKYYGQAALAVQSRSGDRSGWSFGAQRRRHIVRVVC